MLLTEDQYRHIDQPNTTVVNASLSEPFLQAEVLYQASFTILSYQPVTLSLDSDEHLRVYDINPQTQSRQQILDFSVPEIKRVYAGGTVLVIKTTNRSHRFSMNGYGTINAQARGAFGMITMKKNLENNPVDIWIDMLRKHQFPIRLSRVDEFNNKMYAHLTLSILLGFVFVFVATIGISLIVMTLTS